MRCQNTLVSPSLHTYLLLLLFAMLLCVQVISRQTAKLASCANVSLLATYFGEGKQQINICCVTVHSKQLFPSSILRINCFSTKAKVTSEGKRKNFFANFFPQILPFPFTIFNEMFQTAHQIHLWKHGLYVTQFIWLRDVQHLVVTVLIFCLISNKIRNFYTSPNLLCMERSQLTESLQAFMLASVSLYVVQHT